MADTRDEVDAALTKLERDEAVADANHAALDRDVAVGQAATAVHWGAAQAAERADMEEQAIESEAHAQTNAAVAWIIGGLLVVALLGGLIWYLQHQTPPATNTTIIDRTVTPPATPVNTTTVVPVPAPTPVPAQAPTSAPAAPAISQPAANNGGNVTSGTQSQPAPTPIIINNNIPTPAQPAASGAANTNTSSAPNAGTSTPSSVDNGTGTSPSSIDNGSPSNNASSPSGAGSQSGASTNGQ